MNCSRNDVVLLPIPFTDLFLVPISSVLANTDFLLSGWQVTGLNVPSGVKAQLATVEAGLVLKVVGQLVPKDVRALNERLRSWLKL